jgi:MFS family permease
MFKQILWPVLVPSVLVNIGLGAVVPVLVLAALSVGATQAFAAIIVGLAGAVSLAGTVPAGILIDRLGDLRAMLAATGAAIVVTAATVFALAADQPWSLAVYTLSIMARAPINDVWTLARQAYVADTVEPRHVSRAMTALGGSMRVGNLVGPMLSAGLLLVFPIWTVFVFSALAALAAVIVMSLPIGRAAPRARGPVAGAPASETAPQRPTGPAAADTAAGSAAGSPAESSPHSHGPRIRDLDVRWDSVWLAGIGIATLTVARAGQPIIVQLWGVHIGLHESAISLLIALGAALELIIMFLGAYLKDQLGRTTTLITCLAVFGAGFLIMVLLPTGGGLIAAAIVMALGNGLGAGINLTVGADLSPEAGRARFLGVWALFNNLGKLGGPSLISVLIAASGIRFGILATGVTAVAGAAWVLVWRRRIGLPGRQRRIGTPPTDQ